jgi:IS1 family transposase
MATPRQVRTWIAQAEADLAASKIAADGLKECHRRYWIQQSYEKSIKAYAMMRWRGAPADEAEFARLFLLQHSPLKTIEGTNTPLSKALHLLRRETLAFVRSLDNADILLKIDATTPRNDPAEVSYRYPFLVDGEYVAPASYDDWDAYQGNVPGAQSAVIRLLAAVKEELRIFARTPK